MLRERLRSGERVLWLGHPTRRLSPEEGEFNPVISVGFALLGAAMAGGAAAAYLLASEDHGLVLPAQCRIVLIAGLVVSGVFAPFAADYLCSARTVYVLTSQRAIVWRTWWIGRLGLTSYALNELGPFLVRDTDGGKDLVLLEREEWAGEAGIVTVRTSFRDVSNAEHVCALAMSAQQRSGGREQPAAARIGE